MNKVVSLLGAGHRHKSIGKVITGKEHLLMRQVNANLSESMAGEMYQIKYLIAQTKLQDLTANDLDAAMKIIEGTARSMGIEVADSDARTWENADEA